MATNKRRKAYRPRPVGKPITAGAHKAFMLPVRLAVQILTRGDHDDAMFSARFSSRDILATTFNYLSVAGSMLGRDVSTVQRGIQVINELDEGGYEPTDKQRDELLTAVTWCEELLPHVRTDLLDHARTLVRKTLQEAT